LEDQNKTGGHGIPNCNENMVLEQGYLEITRDNSRKKSNYDHLGLHMKVGKDHRHVVLKWQWHKNIKAWCLNIGLDI